MKPTDEAKRLRDEIARAIEYSPDTADDQSHWIINKVLDAAVNGIANDADCDPIDVINKLRPKS